MKNETMKGRLLRSSILAGAAVSMASVAAPAFAQEDGVEEIFVTGSRIAQSSFTGANPVIVFSSEDIEATGQLSVADVLRNSTLNSFGSYAEQSGSTWQSQAQIDLRGFGATRTLVMIDGMRFAASPKLGGGSVNMNAIPTAAIERVDILTGAASSIYGSDAAAGVVNVILKDSYDGLTISGQKTFPAEEGGESIKASLVTGFESDRARVMIALDHSERRSIYRSDRWYDGQVGADQDNYALTEGMSIYSNNFQPYDGVPVSGNNLVDTQIYPLATCQNNAAMVQDGKIFYSPGQGHMCLYDYTPIMAYAAARQFDSAITKFSYDVTDDIEFKMRVMHNRGETFGRYAPVADYFWVDPGMVDLIMVNGGDTSGLGGYDAGNPATFTIVSNDVGGYVYNRFYGSGPRADVTEDYTTDIMLELIGEYNDYTWNIATNWNRQEFSSHGQGYINRELYTKALNDPSNVQDENGDDYLAFDAANQDFVDYFAQSIFSNAKSKYRYIGGGVGGPVAFVEGMEFYAGGEYYDYEYVNDYDDQSATGNVMGSSGNDEAGKRDVKAVYVEAQYDYVENLVLTGSVRYDSYSDFGNATTYKVAGIYDLGSMMDLSEDFSIRASYGTGFIAPDLASLYASDTFSAESAKDFAWCDFNLIAPCSTNQFSTTVHGNDMLDSETSTNFNLGVMGTLLGGDVRLRADYFITEVENVIRYVSVQDMMNMQQADCEDGTTFLADLTAANPGVIGIARAGDVCTGGFSANRVDSSSANSGSFDSSGIDGSATLVRDYDFGSFTFTADATYIIEYNDEEFFQGPMRDWIGVAADTETAFPEWRGKFGTQFDRGDHSILATVNHVDGYTADLGDGEDLGAWTTYDLRYTWQSPWDSTVSVGCTNCTNEDPILDQFNRHNDYLHNIYGMVSYVSVTANF